MLNEIIGWYRHLQIKGESKGMNKRTTEKKIVYIGARGKKTTFVCMKLDVLNGCTRERRPQRKTKTGKNDFETD